jgi:hypothetical protein
MVPASVAAGMEDAGVLGSVTGSSSPLVAPSAMP